MKKLFLLSSLVAAAMFTACSNDDPQAPVTPSEEGAYGDNYISVSIDMPTSLGSRAEGDGMGYFEEGDENESNVDNVVFFFFDAADHCIDVQKIDNPTFTMTSKEDPNVENIGMVEVRLKSGLVYSKVAVAINTNANDANTLKNEITNLNDLKARRQDYAGYIAQGKEVTKEDLGKNQTMSNSVYFTSAADKKPTEAERVILVDIKPVNIYSSAERATITKDQPLPKDKEAVKIYVERVVARVDVNTTNFKVDSYSIEEGKNDATLTLFDHSTLTSRKITIIPVIKGMCLNVLTPDAALIKPLTISQVGYGVGLGDYKNFRWNDPTNKRTYWATTNFNSESAIRYYSYNDAVTQGADAFTQYINPNTQDFNPVALGDNDALVSVNEGSSMNTKVMVVAELHYKYNEPIKEGEEPKKDEGTIDLVRYGADYMLSADLLKYTANLINIDVRNIDWAAKLPDLDAAKIKEVNDSVNNAFVKGLNEDMFGLTMLNRPVKEDEPGDSDWEAKIITSDALTALENADYKIDLDATLLPDAKKVVKETIEKSLQSVNDKAAILYWKDGKTYFYTNIRHQGFYGLVGNDTSNFLYGVVRNHIYKMNLQGFYGLGTPVIEPGRPIDPDRPKDERPSYIKAEINILKWRVVTNNATIH